MSLNSSDQLPGSDRHISDIPRNYKITIRISLIIVLAISLIDLIGWIFNLTIFKSISDQWIPMKIITAICFIITAISLMVIYLRYSSLLIKTFIYSVIVFLCLVSLLTIYAYAFKLSSGQESALAGSPFFNSFLSDKQRMALLSAINFLLIGCILILLTYPTKIKSGIAHILLIPVAFSAYLVLLRYILGVNVIHGPDYIPVAINSGIALLAICAAIFIMNPDTWLMKVISANDSGRVLARKLLPTLMLLPIIIGWLRIKGEIFGLFTSHEGVVFVAAAYTICFLVLIWFTSRSFSAIDTRRQALDEALKNSHKELEERIRERDERTDKLIESEKELQRTKNYFENLINYANAPIIVWDPDTKIQLFNHAFENMTGYSSGDVIGKKLDLLFPRASLKESRAKIKLSLTENWQTIEIPIITKAREIKTVLWNSANIYDTDNKTILSTIAQGHDITRRIAAEQNVLKSKEKLDLALENGQIGIWEWNIETDTLEWDSRMGKMFGMNHDGLTVKFNEFENYIHEEDVAHFRRVVRSAIEDNIPLDTVFRTRPVKKGFNHISVKAIVEKDTSGRAVKLSGVCFDITEMKKGAEKALFNLNEDLRRSNKELEQFAYVASHDLQEPLRMVSSFTQLLAHRYKDKLDADANEFIQYAVDGALRMQSLINDLLEYSRVETKGKNPTVIDMYDILGQAINNLSLKIKEKNALVTNDDLPVVVADGRQMLQLLQNLIDNALKFSDASPIIHISSSNEPDYYLFSVRDNGIGIEPAYFNKIFQIFQRLHAKEDYPGTGIGLAICRRIVERHGGKIWVESKPGQGTIFYFTIIKTK
jgi:PAS domain S-box-containing protein